MLHVTMLLVLVPSFGGKEDGEGEKEERQEELDDGFNHRKP